MFPVAALALCAAMVACTGGPVRVDPPNAPDSVISSADRIRAGHTRLGGSARCLRNAYCAAGLSRVYGIDLGNGGVDLDTPAAIVGALAAGAVDVGALPASAVEVADSRIVLLADDRRLAPADNVVPVVSAALARSGGPTLTAAVDQVSAALDSAGLTAIDQALAGGALPELSARSWLRDHTLTPAPPPPGSPPIVIGARADDESRALSDLYAGALSRAGWAATVKAVGGGRSQELDALELGKVDLVPDRTAALLEHLVGYTGTADEDLNHNLVLLRFHLADLGLAALGPAPAVPGTVFAVSKGVAAALGIASLSDLSRATGARLPAVPAATPLTPAELATDTEGPPPPPPATLGIGTSGAPVMALQQRLAQLGFAQEAPTGTFDEATRRAVLAFQADQGLITDGAVDPATGRALTQAHPVDHPPAAPAPGDPGSIRPATAVSGPGSASAVYLAFADGPSSVTPQILDLLANNNARATFFANYDSVAIDPETLRQITAAGDAVGISAWPHNATSPVASDVLFRTVSATQEAIATLDGKAPSCLLAPYGASDPATRQRATARGLAVALADVDPQDWLHPGAAAIANDVIASVRPGSIVLLHDGGGDRSQTVTALGAIVTTLTSLGYRFSALPGC